MQPAAAVMEVHLAIGRETLDLRLPVPEGSASLRSMLPAVREMSNAFIRIGVEGLAAQGQEVSCRAGCGACCRQLVPIAAAEAHALSELVSAMPPERQARVRRRFAEGRQALEAAQLEAPLAALASAASAGTPDAVKRLAEAYFAVGAACPFLEDESCSIHEARPVACREYLVVSPPACCSTASGDGVDNVVHLFKLKDALLAVGGDAVPHDRPGFVPLIHALEWAATHPESTESAEPREWLDRLFRRMHALL